MIACGRSSFLALALAIEQKPHRPPGWTSRELPLKFSIAGTAVFAMGLLIYFVLIPSSVNRDAYESAVPSFYLFLTLDGLLAVRDVLVQQEVLIAGLAMDKGAAVQFRPILPVDHLRLRHDVQMQQQRFQRPQCLTQPCGFFVVGQWPSGVVQEVFIVVTIAPCCWFSPVSEQEQSLRSTE